MLFSWMNYVLLYLLSNITSITRLPLGNGNVLFLVKIFDVEFLPDLHVLRSLEFKKWFLEIGLCVCMCVCVRAYVCGCKMNI